MSKNMLVNISNNFCPLELHMIVSAENKIIEESEKEVCNAHATVVTVSVKYSITHTHTVVRMMRKVSAWHILSGL